MKRKMQSRLIVITGLGGLNLACGGFVPCGPLPKEGSCVIERQCLIPTQAFDCGLNGYECKDGQWGEVFTYCNPAPPLAPPEPCPEGTNCDTGGAEQP